VLDGAGTHRWSALLHTGGAVFGALDWWPAPTASDVATPLLAALCGPQHAPVVRARARTAQLPDAGMTILRSGAGDEEIWCRCDGGPHGFLSIAAHAHADALSVELRHGGVEVLADPGTYCYHGEPRWRRYFRSTLGHNTLELDGRDQSVSAGPFLWTAHAVSRTVSVRAQASPARWVAEHAGYGSRRRPVLHRRTVELDARTLRVADEVRSARGHDCRLAFHLGPGVEVQLDSRAARLAWAGAGTVLRRAQMSLPATLRWQVHRGQHDPPLGWYSAGFGRREPSVTLIGQGRIEPGSPPLHTVLVFDV
jgi:hypothetical protein